MRIAFSPISDERWVGGVNYLKNLLFAIHTLEGRPIRPVLFVGEKTPDRIVRIFEPYAEVARSALFDNGGPIWFLRKIILKSCGKDLLCKNIFKQHKIDVVSHCYIYDQGMPFKTVNWIPDFQHLHLPEMFSPKELASRNKKYLWSLKRSDRVIVSSQDARDDVRRFAPEFLEKVRVLRFVSQPDPGIYETDDRERIEKKYDFTGKFFYLPNQFWKHKNHTVVFAAVKELAKRGINILVLCTGHTADYRNKEHFSQLKKIIDDHGLNRNIRILGLVDYRDVLWFMRHSVSIINPSLFEGWSSTVEEAKSIGKNMVLSDIPVHREQDPPNSVYFNPSSPEELADVLARKWQVSEGGPDFELECVARKNLRKRTKAFAEAYLEIVRELVNPPQV